MNIFIYLVNYERNLLWSPFCKSFIVNWNLVNTRAVYELASGPVCLLQTVMENKAKDAFTLLLKGGASLSLQLKMLPPILCGTHYSSDDRQTDSTLESNSMLAHAKLEFYTNLVLRLLHFHEKGSDLQFGAQQYWPAKVLFSVN